MSQHIHEGTTIKVRAKLVSGVSETGNVKFMLYQDGTTKCKEVTAQLSDIRALRQEGWVEASCTVPNVDAAKDSYLLSYKVQHGSDTPMEDFPPFRVWPKTGKLKAIHAAGPLKDKEFTGFRFKVLRNGVQQGDIKRIVNSDGTYTFDLMMGYGYTIEAVSPYKICRSPNETTGDGWIKKTGPSGSSRGMWTTRRTSSSPPPARSSSS